MYMSPLGMQSAALRAWPRTVGAGQADETECDAIVRREFESKQL
jgi:hypothetical protein